MALFIPVAVGVATTLAAVLSYETGKKSYQSTIKQSARRHKDGENRRR